MSLTGTGISLVKALGEAYAAHGAAGSIAKATHIAALKSNVVQATVSAIPVVGDLPVGKVIDSGITGKHHAFTRGDYNKLDVNHDGHLDLDDVKEFFHKVSDIGDQSHQTSHATHATGHAAHATGHAAHATGHAAHATGHLAHAATVGHVAAAGACPPIALTAAAISGSIYAGKKFVENDMNLGKTCDAIDKDIESVGKNIEKTVDSIGEGMNSLKNGVTEALDDFADWVRL